MYRSRYKYRLEHYRLYDSSSLRVHVIMIYMYSLTIIITTLFTDCGDEVGSEEEGAGEVPVGGYGQVGGDHHPLGVVLDQTVHKVPELLLSHTRVIV